MPNVGTSEPPIREPLEYEGKGSREFSTGQRRKSLHFQEVVSARELDELREENAMLRRLVAELSLQKLVLRDLLVAKGL
jgi:hypothetical protein